MSESTDQSLVTVCKECLRASCWQGEFYCERAKTADVVQMARGELRSLRLEHPSYLLTDKEFNSPARAEYARRLT